MGPKGAVVEITATVEGASYTHVFFSRPYRTPFTLLLTFVGHKPFRSLLTVPQRALAKRTRGAVDIPTIVEAPLAAGQPIAELRVNLGEQELLRTSLHALEDNPRGSFWQRTADSISLMFE